MAEVHNKIPFDFTDVDLIRKAGFRTKDKKEYFNLTHIREFELEVGFRRLNYQTLFDKCEYYNETLNQWLPCEKVGN